MERPQLSPLETTTLATQVQRSLEHAIFTGELKPGERLIEVDLAEALQVSRASLRDWCVFDLTSVSMPRTGHAVASAAALERALDRLDAPRGIDAKRLAGCRDGVERALAARVAEAEHAIAAGDRAQATGILNAIDAHYGGVAAAAIASLRGTLGPH